MKYLPDFSKRSARIKFWIVAAVLGVCMVAAIWDDVKHPPDVADLAAFRRINSPIRYVTKDTFGVVKFEDFGDIFGAAQSGDIEAVNAMLGDGRVYQVARGTRVNLIGEFHDAPHVIAETGPHIGKTFYIIGYGTLSTLNPWSKQEPSHEN